MSCKYLQRTVKQHLSVISHKQFYRSFCASAITQNDNYISPTYDQIEEYTQTIASVLHSWPLQHREYFISTLHKAQANPKRNKNYDHILNNKIPKDYLQYLDTYKLKQWLPFVFVNDIIQLMNEIEESPILTSINNGQHMISYDGNNPQHLQILNRIKTQDSDKMIWVQDIPLNTTDVKLAQTFNKFGNVSAIIMDRYQSVKQQNWIRHKQNELKANQKDELIKTIQKLRNDMNRNMINDYQQEYLCIELDIDNNYGILRLIMAHLQYQFDIHDIQLVENKKLLIPVCLDSTISDILSQLKNDCKFYYEYGNIILSTAANKETLIRNTLNKHRLVSNIKRLGAAPMLGKYGKLEDGSIEIEITFMSKIESSIKDFVISLCTDYYNISTANKLLISHHIPYHIPTWYRNMNEQTKSEFFSCTMEDTDIKSIAQRMSKLSSDGDEELHKTLMENTTLTTCNAFVYFTDMEAINTLICPHTKLWGMVINGERCRISTAPTQIKLKNIPYDGLNPIRYHSFYKPCTQTMDKIFTTQSLDGMQYDDNDEIIPPILKRVVAPEKSHIPIGSEHIQYCVPYFNTNNNDCNGLKYIYTQTEGFQHTHFCKDSLNSRLDYEAPGIHSDGRWRATVADKTHLLMKYSQTINIGLPLIGGVLQYMLMLTPVNNFCDSFMSSYEMDMNNNDIKDMPIVANKVKINMDNVSYIWKHASCSYENNELFWYLDDNVTQSIIKGKKIKEKLAKNENALCARMGYVCVYSKRYRKIKIISHGINEDKGEASQEISPKIINNNSNINDFDAMLNELYEWLDEEIDENRSQTIAKSVSTKNNSEFKQINKIENDLKSRQNMFVYINGIKHKHKCMDNCEGSDMEEEAIILHRGWNHLLIDFGLNDINNGSFQIINFNDNQEIHDLSWRYSPPPISLILQFNNHINALQMYDKLNTVKQKKYGIRVQLCQYDDEYLENNAILQSELVQDNDMLDSYVNNGMEMEDLGYSIINGHANGHREVTMDRDRLVDDFVNGIVENIHNSNKIFDHEPKSKKIYDDTRKYSKILAEYSPCQMLQYDDGNIRNSTTEMFNTSLNVPSTLELKENIIDNCDYVAQKFK